MKLHKMTSDECRLTNAGIASLSRFKIDRIQYSIFDVGRSMFGVHQFLFLDLTGRQRPAAAACMKLHLFNPQNGCLNRARRIRPRY
ncbi:hypothetical protein D1AOALGA4SA_4197 [Olavius algarvensis Delta 1 endosymbiont]|nr:hypothetical protein D1AOALGA4SA_4197 [Olavius algarvensis Delta 1 endosymbiont]